MKEAQYVRCFKCLTEVPTGTEVCPNCGQVLIPKAAKKNKETKDPAGTQIKQKEYQIGDTIKDRYEVRGELGKKGTGFTYKVRDKEKKKTFVLKQIHSSLITSDESKARFFDIIKEVIKMNLHEVVSIHDYGEDNGAIYFVSEYIEGLTLRKLLDVRKEMKQFFKGEELESILTQICKALITAHNHGVIHGDLKPENIFILPSGLKITEFGITGSFSPLDFTSIQQDMGDAYKYIAPEIVIGGNLSKSSDIYSLGAIVYEMLTGVIPGSVVNPLNTYNSELPPAANDIVLKALRQDPEQRTQYVFEFYKNLLESLDQKAGIFEEKPWITKQTAETEQTGKLQTEVDEELLMYVETGRTAPAPASDKQGPVSKEEKPAPPAPEKNEVPQPEPPKPSTSAQPEQEQQPEKEKSAEEIKESTREPGPQAAEATKQIPPAEHQHGNEERVIAKPAEQPVKEEISGEKIEAEKIQPAPEPAVTEQPKQEMSKQQEEISRTIPEVIPEKIEQTKPEPEQTGIDDIAKHLGIITEELQGTKPIKPKPAGPVQEKPPVSQSQVDKSAPQRVEPAPARQIPPKSAPVAATLETKKKPAVLLIAGTIVLAAAALIVTGWFLLKSPSKEVSGVTPPKTNKAIETNTKPVTAAEHAVTGTVVQAKPPVERQEVKKQEIKKPVERPRREKKIAAAPKPLPPKCPADMAYIPSGSFIMGSSPSDPLRDFSEKPDVRTYVRSFCIDKYEYPDQEGVIPQTNVSFYKAERLCRAEGKQLCSEDEWEKACKGPSSLKYPYGNVWNSAKCDTQNKDGTNRSIVPSGTYRACVSGYGVYDMSGNVMEWTDNIFSPQDTTDKVVKGGSFTKPDWATRCAYRYNMLPTSTSNEVGFRCCKPPER